MAGAITQIPPPATARRLVATIFVAVSFATTAFFAAFTLGPLVALEVTSSAVWAGLPVTAAILGTALGASLLARVMAAGGRRRGLVVGYLSGAAGMLLGALAVETASLALLLVGMVLVGVSNGGSQQARFAAAETQPPESRASALSLVVWAATIGAALGPTIARSAGPVAELFSAPVYAGAFLVGAVLLAGAAAILGTLLRPDPSSFVEPNPSTGIDAAAPAPGGISLWSPGAVRTALLGLVGSQLSMVLIMTTTPVHIGDHHDLGVIGTVMTSHFVGMFALAPVAGRLGDRFGPRPILKVGLAVLVAAGITAATLPVETGTLLSLPLFLLGIGWSFTFVSGSALLASNVAPAARMRLQGNVDATIWTTAAAASMSSGLVFSTLGYAWLSLAGAALAALPLLLILRR